MLRSLVAVAVGLSLGLSAAFAAQDIESKKRKGARELAAALQKANEAYQKKEWDTVIAITTKIIDSGANLPGNWALTVHQLRAISYVSKTPRDCKGALPSLEEVNKLANDNHEFWSITGICQNELKTGDRGLAAYSKAIELDPANAGYYQGRCFVYYQTEKHAQAVADCKKAVQLNQTDAQSYKVLGSAYDKLNQDKESLAAWKAVLELEPNNDMAKRNVDVLSKRVKQ